VEIFLSFLRNPPLGLQFGARLSPLQYPVVLLGVHVERLLLEHLGAGQRQPLDVGRGGGRGPGAGHHHDDVVAAAAGALARARHLDHLLALLQLLELHLLLLLRLLLALALLHHGLVDERLPVCGLQDLLPVLYLDDLLAALHLGHGQHLDLLGADLLAPLQLHLAPCSLHVLHDDLLTIGGVDNLLALAARNHPRAFCI